MILCPLVPSVGETAKPTSADPVVEPYHGNRHASYLRQ